MINRSSAATTLEQSSVTRGFGSIGPRARDEVKRDARAPVTVEACGALASVGFFLAYMVLHALHLAERDPAFTHRLSVIPLFATFWASALFGAAPGALASLLLRDQLALRSWLPCLLGVVTLLFTIEIAIFP